MSTYGAERRENENRSSWNVGVEKDEECGVENEENTDEFWMRLKKKKALTTTTTPAAAVAVVVIVYTLRCCSSSSLRVLIFSEDSMKQNTS